LPSPSIVIQAPSVPRTKRIAQEGSATTEDDQQAFSNLFCQPGRRGECVTFNPAPAPAVSPGGLLLGCLALLSIPLLALSRLRRGGGPSA
jgi:hypothetical protein